MKGRAFSSKKNRRPLRAGPIASAAADAAMLLCAGRAMRLRPLSHFQPKAMIPLLNLPMLCFNWFHLESLGVSSFLLNSHLFSKKFSAFARSLKRPKQRLQVFHERRPLGSAGSLREMGQALPDQAAGFFALNGDSLFFPLSRGGLKPFALEAKRLFAASAKSAGPPLKGLLYGAPMRRGAGALAAPRRFAAPFKAKDDSSALWADQSMTLRRIGPPGFAGAKRLRPYQFSGLFAFSRRALNDIKPEDFHIFEDVLKQRLQNGEFKVFSDPKALILKADDIPSYLAASGALLSAVFSKKGKDESLKTLLRQIFSRFDPKDQIIGLQRGLKWGRRLNMPLLAPKSVRGLEFLSGKGFAVLGARASLFGKSFIERGVLGPGEAWQGDLKDQALISRSSFPSLL